MANTIKVKRSATPGKVPQTTDLQLGEFAINTYDGKVYTKQDNGSESIIEVTGSGATGVSSVAGKTGAVTLYGSDIVNTPSGNIAATDVQNAINELDSEKAATGHNHDSTYQPLDTVYDITKALTLTTDWQSTGIKGSNLATGTYIVQIYAHDIGSGGTNSNEYYSGVMSWYAGNTDSEETDEIALHRAGASTDGNIYLRTRRTLSADTDDLVLDIRSNLSTISNSNYVFKFRKFI